LANATLRLENVLSLVRAELKNEPFITSFDGIAYEAKRVQRGDLFIALDPKEIDEAVQNGAYGIIFDTHAQISDTEIAWLQVKDIHNALLRVVRFYLLAKDITAYSVDAITLSLFQTLIIPDIQIIEGALEENLKKIFSLREKDIVVYSHNCIDNELFTHMKSVYDLPQKHTIECVEKTLFETSFCYKGLFYERVPLAYILFEYFQRVLNVLDDAHKNFRIRNHFEIKHFQPLFINKHFQAVEFGQSAKVLIFEDNIQLFLEEIRYLQKNASWAKILIAIDKEHAKLVQEQSPTLFIYTTKKSVSEKLKVSSFDFALLFNIDKTILQESALQIAPKQLSLF